ncbi:MAG: choice-of-anchor D domain-containing protein [Bdellovibrionales bacterium]|nr:choice-of-anchor D domain-containing protein [Bdellovibrionales bacterium]
MKRSITRQIAAAAVFISCVALFQNCGPAKVSTSDVGVVGSSADLGSSTPDAPSSTPIPASTPPVSSTPVAMAAAFSASKTTLDFGNVAFGDTSAQQVVVVTNTGNANLTLTRTLVGGDFSLSNTGLTNACTNNISLAPGQSCSLGARFSPFATTGAVTGMIRFNSNAPNSPHLIQLMGNSTFF